MVIPALPLLREQEEEGLAVSHAEKQACRCPEVFLGMYREAKNPPALRRSPCVTQRGATVTTGREMGPAGSIPQPQPPPCCPAAVGKYAHVAGSELRSQFLR